jgi:hypothetical protein
MDRPNATQNISSGVVTSSRPLATKSPTSHRRWPFWNKYAMAPNEAARLSRFSTTACSGMTTLPVNKNSSTSMLTAMIAAAQGIPARSIACSSANVAACPPTRAGPGVGVARTAST